MLVKGKFFLYLEGRIRGQGSLKDKNKDFSPCIFYADML